MRYLSVIILILALTGFVAQASADRSGEFILNDGSKIVGKVISLDNGIYKIRSDTLGMISIEESKIRSFNYNGGEPQAQENGQGINSGLPDTIQGIDVRAIENNILENENILQMVMALQNDPAIQSIINDPNLKNAIETGDINALMNNPAFLELLNNTRIKEIQKEIIPGK
ncbi:MAG: hypothetical protein KJ737_22425 [Proteobacteria bacterium]|nr:hypothetical protein [Pseudomonadota bacterium]